jgi:ubiquinone/menaquinone biosynthesis C-methylase UbiE
MAFQRASAAALPFEDVCFDAAPQPRVYEVGDVRDKRELIREALRVVKRTAAFASGVRNLASVQMNDSSQTA